MIKNGYALVRDAGGAEVAWWQTIPERVDVPGTTVGVFGASVGWSGGGHHIVARAKEFADPPSAVIPVIPPLNPYGVPDISDRQFFQKLALDGVITKSEALAAVRTGDIPAAMQAIVDQITDADQRFAAEMLLSGATVFQRGNYLTEAVRTSRGMTSDECDQFFRDAAAL